MRAGRQSSGFTLVEILVVLVLTSLVSGLLLQGLQQAYRLQRYFGTEIFHAQREAMQIDWFRNSINGIVPDHVDGKSKFSGESRRMRGQTTAPMNSPDGSLVPFVWRIDFDPQSGESGLYPSEDRAVPPIITWPGNGGRFRYIDAATTAHDAWPPLLGKAPQVPAVIVLEMGGADASRAIIATPCGPDMPWPRRSDL